MCGQRNRNAAWLFCPGAPLAKSLRINTHRAHKLSDRHPLLTYTIQHCVGVKASHLAILAA